MTPDMTSDTLPWWKGAVIYQIYPRSFQDSNGDGIGDLNGITARLDHVAKLGADAIWISPFFTSPMRDFGYDIADYCDVDPIFGTLADFDALVARVEQGGIDEVVLAMNATLEGQTTAHYLAERLESFPIRLTQLAHGVPVGGELDYLDEGTLAQALRARRPVG